MEKRRHSDTDSKRSMQRDGHDHRGPGRRRMSDPVAIRELSLGDRWGLQRFASKYHGKCHQDGQKEMSQSTGK